MWDLNDYIIEAMQVGIIETVVDPRFPTAIRRVGLNHNGSGTVRPVPVPQSSSRQAKVFALRTFVRTLTVAQVFFTVPMAIPERLAHGLWSTSRERGWSSLGAGFRRLA